jgi:hypothetical protein
MEWLFWYRERSSSSRMKREEHKRKTRDEKPRRNSLFLPHGYFLHTLEEIP